MTQSKPLTAAEAAAYPRLFMISETVYDLICKADQGLQNRLGSAKLIKVCKAVLDLQRAG